MSDALYEVVLTKNMCSSDTTRVKSTNAEELLRLLSQGWRVKSCKLLSKTLFDNTFVKAEAKEDGVVVSINTNRPDGAWTHIDDVRNLGLALVEFAERQGA